jgi:hypothetical protein
MHDVGVQSPEAVSQDQCFDITIMSECYTSLILKPFAQQHHNDELMHGYFQ